MTISLFTDPTHAFGKDVVEKLVFVDNFAHQLAVDIVLEYIDLNDKTSLVPLQCLIS